MKKRLFRISRERQRPKDNKDKGHFVGAFIPPQVTLALTLESTLTGKSKSRIITESLEKTLRKQQPHSSILRALADRIIAAWDYECKTNTGRAGWEDPSKRKKKYNEFMRAVMLPLRKRKLPDTMIDQIRAHVDEHYEKNYAN